jgi:AcrR family transcriptional regulator
MLTEMSKRKYTLKRRAQQQEQTRARIVEAAMALHEELGPRDTTLSAIAERAGVQRLTVYRHFPDDGSLFEACTTRWIELNPPPDPSRWEAVQEPAERTRRTLAALYGYYRRTQRMWAAAYRDREEVPAIQGPMRGFDDYLAGVRDELVSVWRPVPAIRRFLKASVGHSLRFSTWQSLSGAGMGDRAMAELVVRWLTGVLRPSRVQEGATNEQ